MRAIDLCAALSRHQDGVILRSQAEVLGLSPSSWRAVCSAAWAPLLTGAAFVPGDPRLPAEPGVRQRARAAVLATGGEGHLCRGSVLRLRGVQGTPVDDPEHVLLRPPGRRQREGVRLHWEAVPPRDLLISRGMPMTTLREALHQALRCDDRAHAVSVLDSAAHQELLDATQLASLAVGCSAERRRWLHLVDDRAESPLETRTRLLLHDQRIGGVQPQVRVTLPGYGTVRIDHLLQGFLALESDGRGPHDGPSPAYRDRRRQEALVRAGFVVVRVTWADVVHDPTGTMVRIRRALADGPARGLPSLPLVPQISFLTLRP